MNGTSLQSPKQYISGIDWRYLLPLNSTSRVLIVDQGSSDFDQVFHNLGVSVTILSSSQLFNISAVATKSLVEQSFDIIASPMGILQNSSTVKRREYLEVQKLLRRLIHPKGVLVFGFSNRWSFHPTNRVGDNYLYLSTWEVLRLLRDLMYESIYLYGAYPDLILPEYIFPIKGETISFVLRHRYHSRLPKPMVHFLQTPFTSLLKNFLPYYYVLAKVSE